METRPLTGLEKARAIQGWMKPRELAFLFGVAHSIPPGGKVVEIGSWKGRSTVAICEGLHGASMYAVDTFRGDADLAKRYAGEIEEDRVYEEFCEHTAPYAFLEVLRMTSAEACGRFDDASLDWVFIDGDHTFEQVHEDISCWLPKVKPGGLVSGHDYPYGPIKKAVDMHVRPNIWETIWYARVAPAP
jgi:predicted O-methyltransferase YrrM